MGAIRGAVCSLIGMPKLTFPAVLGGLCVIASLVAERPAPRSAHAPAPGLAGLEVLDTDRDGKIERFEALAAAFALVQDAAREEEPHGEGPVVVSVAALQRAAEGMAAEAAPAKLDDGRLELSVDGTRILASGTVDAGADARLLELLVRERGASELVLDGVRAHPREGHAYRLAAIVKASGLGVRVPVRSTINAFTAVTVLAAAERRWIDPGARITVDGDAGQQLSSAHVDALRTESSELALLETGSDASLRGLAAVSVDVAWATGSGATVLRTVDGGASFRNVAPDSIRGLDVRDVQAWSEDVAWILTAGPGDASRILTTEDGGATWTERHRESSPASFLDGFDAWDPQRGLAYGDPFAPEGSDVVRFHVLATADGGASWTPVDTAPAPLAGGEASFAASGTGIRLFDRVRAWIATGANDGVARVLWTEDGGATWTASDTTLPAGKPASGAFSLAFRADGGGVAVGGDFTDRGRGGVECASWTADFGATWHAPQAGPRGQRAGSAALLNGHFLATGQTGTDISRDGGKTWSAFSSEGFHCVEVSARDGAVWFAGPQGRVATLRR